MQVQPTRGSVASCPGQMSLSAGDASMLGSESDPAAVRMRFLGWQCRLRQIAIREDGGRPGPGMTPRLRVDLEGLVPDSIVVQIIQSEPAEMTNQLRHIYRSTLDPRSRYERALGLLRTGYFQHPEHFSDVMTALFGPGSATAQSLLSAQQCVLEFDHYSQRYRLPCRITHLDEDSEAWQATYWHNALFSPHIAANCVVLGFAPDWQRAGAEP